MDTGRRRYLILMSLGAVLFLVCIYAAAVGPADISFATALRIIAGTVLAKAGSLVGSIPHLHGYLEGLASDLAAGIPGSYLTIVLQVRLPRVVLGLLVGMSLAAAGTCFQALFKNPMADPYVIGVSSGASMGAAVAIVLGAQIPLWGTNWGLPIFAFAGALGTVFAVYNIARVNGSLPVTTLLLAGIAMASFLSAGVYFLMFINSDSLHGIVFWIMGSLSGANWVFVKMMSVVLLVGSGVMLFHARNLNVILLGEEAAQQLGIEVERLKMTMFAACSFVVGAAVSVSGVIGFVGLIIPHIVRLLVGPDHRILLPAAALSGGLFLILCDTLARTVMPPSEIPVGIVTAFAGAPFFIYLLRRNRREFF